MPCEFIPRIVNNTYIAVEPRVNKLEQTTVHEAKGKVEQDKDLGWTNRTDLKGKTCQLGRTGLGYGSYFGGHTEMFQNDMKFRDYRILPRVFSTLEDFGVIEEVESASSSDQLGETTNWFSRPRAQHCESPRRKSTSSWPSETQFTDQRSQDFSQYRDNRRRQSQGVLVSGRKTFGLVGYQNKNESSENMLSCGKQRSGNLKPNIKRLLNRESVTEEDITTHDCSVPSFDIMSSVAAVLDRPKSYSLPRKLSMPVQVPSVQYDMASTGSALPSDERKCLQNYSFDNDTELQWEKLVARAKTLQFSLPKRPEIIPSILSYNNKEQIVQKATKSAGDLENGVDNRLQEERMYEDKTVGKENNKESTRRRRKSDEKRYSLKIIVNGVESSDDSQNKKDCSDKLSAKMQPGTPVIGEQRSEITTDRNQNEHRRHSVAVLRPTQGVSEKVSGYSTHGALEYAKMLLGKIQEEGKTKSKKERLGEMSRVLKLILEELNRIELPDRDLVSLFISLRAKIVNLKAELKADEGKKDKEKDEESNDKLVSKTNILPRAGSHEEITTSVHSRRFSWC